MDVALAHALRLAVAGERPALAPWLREELRPHLRDPHVLQTLQHHRLVPWLYAAWLEAGAEESEEAAFLHHAAAAASADALSRVGELQRLRPRFREAGVDAILLKGPAVAALYPASGLRPFRDLDLLVREEQLGDAAGVLSGFGYQERDDQRRSFGGMHVPPHRVFFHVERAQVVELHADPFQAGLRPLDIDGIWERSAASGRRAAGWPVLAYEDMAVELCVHLHKHGFDGLLWFKDLDLLLRDPSVQWDAVAERAGREGYLASVAYALELLPRLLWTPLPEGARRIAGRRSPAMRRMQHWTWPPERLERLEPQRLWRFRRAIQFTPESGAASVLPSLVFSGRRRQKVSIALRSLFRRPTPA